MPRIEADSIEAHVEAQNQRILDAAMGLFEARGYAGTELRDIAQSVGLARNSLYRYYPGKDHILLACLHRDMSPGLERVRALDDKYPAARDRIDAWLAVQMDIAATTCHGAMRLVANLQDHSPEFRAEIHKLHAPAAGVLRRAVTEVLAGTGRDAELVSAMLTSLLNAAAAKMMESGGRDEVLAELRRSVHCILNAGSHEAASAAV